MSIIELTKENFSDTVKDAKTLIIDFWAPWCGPCKQFAPTFEEAADKHSDITFAKVNTEEQQELAAALKIRSIPTLMAFRENVLLFNQAGALPPQNFEELIQKIKEVNMQEVHEAIAKQEQQQAQAKGQQAN
ncbi:thioredoxin [Brackiella oedipodis]|uniref:thioredoxin n=1 Tax=Brackiella oedipodis TaxID=124225 RepID=UPI00048DF3C2|nr:thioredoxin [Brackiella oedipodis]